MMDTKQEPVAWRYRAVNGSYAYFEQEPESFRPLLEPLYPASALASKDAEIAGLREQVKGLAKALVDHNDAMRSAYQIASRDGEETNWIAFARKPSGMLSMHHETVNAARAELEKHNG